MSTNEPNKLVEYLQQHVEADPKSVLEIALAETQRTQAEAAKTAQEYKEQTEITLGDEGFETKTLAQLYRLATVYSRTLMVPESYRNRPYDCAVVLNLAKRWKLDPFLVFQQVYFVHGKPGLQGQLVIALLNTSGKLEGPLTFSFTGTGDDYGCMALGIDTRNSASVAGPKVTMRMVKAEGWDRDKKGQPSKWKTMPELMFRYRAAALFGRMLYPEVLMGMQTTEELEDVGGRGPKVGQTLDPGDLDAVAAHLAAGDDVPEDTPQEEAGTDDDGGTEAPSGDEDPFWNTAKTGDTDAGERATEGPPSAGLLPGMTDAHKEERD